MKKRVLIYSFLFSIILFTQSSFAMHIMEGFLPPIWSGIWFLITIPFVVFGVISIKKIHENNSRLFLLLAMAGAFVFVLSALKIPSVTGSCSHPTGVGFGAILFGPSVMSVLGSIVLLFQAVLLAHGGLTTLGANAFSMAVVGPFVAYGVYYFMTKSNAPRWLAVFLGASVGNLMTYVVTSIQLAIAFPSELGGVLASLYKFLSIFALTQIPLAVSEGILTVLMINAIIAYEREEFKDLRIYERGKTI